MPRDLKKQNGNKQTNKQTPERPAEQAEGYSLKTLTQTNNPAKQTKISEDGKAAARTKLAEMVAVFSADPPWWRFERAIEAETERLNNSMR